MQALAKIERPVGAVAATRQTFRTIPTPPPPGMAFSHGIVGHRTMTVPNDTAAPGMMLAFDSFLSSHAAVASRRTGDAEQLRKGETMELTHALEGVVRTDGSLPPRFVGLTLLYYGQVSATDPKTYLDAFGYWASTEFGLDNATLGAQIMRFTVFCDFEASWFARAVASETTQFPPNILPHTVQICVRWATPTGMRAAFADLPSGVGLDQALVSMQNFLISLKTLFSVPISDSVCVSHANVSANSWLESMSTASKTFSLLCEGTPHVEKSAFLKANTDVDIVELNIFVRLSERARGAAGIHHSTAFHGFLIGNAQYADEIRAMCERCFELPMPDADTAKYCLHTSGVQVQEMPLGTRVSMYAPGGNCGESIYNAGNFIHRFDPAIVPIEAVIGNFIVTPCTHASTMPSDRRLEKAAILCANRAYTLFCSVFGNAKLPLSGAESEKQPLCTTTVDDTTQSTEEIYTNTAFGIDFDTRRLRVGDAFTALSARNAPSKLTAFFLNSTMKFGVNVGMLDAIGMAANSLVDFSLAPQIKDEERMERIRDGAILVGCKRVREKTSTSRGIREKNISALIAAAGLSAPKQSTLPSADAECAEFSNAVITVAHILLPGTELSQSILAGASDAAKAARFFGAVNAVAAISAFLMLNPNTRKAPIFIISIIKGEDRVQVYNIDAENRITCSTAGALLDATPRHVFLVREGSSGSKTVLRAMVDQN